MAPHAFDIDPQNLTLTVHAQEFAAEIAARQERPNTRFIVYDHAIAGDRAWFRFTLTWTDASTGEARTRAGVQLYRVEGGKPAWTWLTLLKLGSAWPDAVGQEHWTSKGASGTPRPSTH